IRGSDTSERYSITDALISFCSSLIVISWTRFGRAQEIMRRGHAQAVLASDRKRSIFDAIALASALDDFPELSVQGLDGVRRVDSTPHFWREAQERRDFVPAFAPGLTDHRILMVPHFFELFQRSLSGLDVG